MIDVENSRMRFWFLLIASGAVKIMSGVHCDRFEWLGYVLDYEHFEHVHALLCKGLK